MAGRDAREYAFSGITTVNRRHSHLPAGTRVAVAGLDFSGKHDITTLASSFQAFLEHLAARLPAGQLVLVLDNVGYHCSHLARRWWVQHRDRIRPCGDRPIRPSST